MKQLIFIITIVLASNFGFAQNFDSEIKELNRIGKSIISETSDDDKLKANEEFKTVLKKIVSNNSSFDFAFDSLRTISILQTENLKIYNWTIPFNDGTYTYFAFLQIKKDKEQFEIVELIDKSDEISKPENKVLSPKNWYGALYYQIIENKKLGKNTYTLLGWDGNNQLTNKKIIDVITIANYGMVKIGASIFKAKKGSPKRVIFEYSENAVMSLKYHKQSHQIVFDYLVPASSKLKGIYEYYGPALNRFDSYKLVKKKWAYQEDVDIELDKSIKDFIWNDPKKK